MKRVIQACFVRELRFDEIDSVAGAGLPGWQLATIDIDPKPNPGPKPGPKGPVKSGCFQNGCGVDVPYYD